MTDDDIIEDLIRCEGGLIDRLAATSAAHSSYTAGCLRCQSRNASIPCSKSNLVT